MNILVSACLLGLDCRYCGGGCPSQKVINLKQTHHLIPVCPEQMGGLATPRDTSELCGNAVITSKHNDVTQAFKKGAMQALEIAKLLDCSVAVLKKNSPSCGYGIVYDGTFSGVKVKGNGVTANLLAKNNIKIYNEDTCTELY